MKYKSSEINQHEIVYCDLIVEKENKKGKRIIIEEEEIKKVVYKELDGYHNKKKVIDVMVKARLGYSFNR